MPSGVTTRMLQVPLALALMVGSASAAILIGKNRKPTPATGFAVGFERIMIALANAGVELAPEPEPCVYVACTKPEFRDAVFSTTLALRRAGLRVEADYQGKSLKAQFKQADKVGAAQCVVLGPDEVEAGTATVRDMATHEQTTVPQTELATHLAQLLA